MSESKHLIDKIDVLSLLTLSKKKRRHNPKYARFNRRMIAGTLDTILLTFLEPAINTVIPIDVSTLETLNDSPDNPNIRHIMAHMLASPAFIQTWLLNTALQMIVFFLFSALCWHLWSATPGKMLMRIKVVDAKTELPPSNRQIALRLVGYLLSASAFFIRLFLDRDRQKMPRLARYDRRDSGRHYSLEKKAGYRESPPIMKLLLIEDDKESAKYLMKGLKEQGYVTDHCDNGKDGLFMAASEKYDAMIIDRMVPEIDGITIIQTLRASGNETPMIILTALDKVEERVKGLKSGADDYLAKPYSFTELLARLEAITRRKAGEKAVTKLTCGDLEMDLLTRVVKRSDKIIDLQAREFALLEYLMRNCGTVVTRTMLLEHVWDYNFDPQTNVIDVHISRLRHKIDKGFEKTLIQTLRGAGYKLTA